MFLLASSAYAKSPPAQGSKYVRIQKITGQVMLMDSKQRAKTLRGETWMKSGDHVQTTRTSTAELFSSGLVIKMAPQSLARWMGGASRSLQLMYGVFYLDAQGAKSMHILIGPSTKWTLKAEKAKVLIAAVEDAARFNALQSGEMLDLPAELNAQHIQVAVREGEASLGDHKLIEGDAFQILKGQGDHFPTHPGSDPVKALVRAFGF